MNVKRFIGRTARDALRMLREELGPDALVLANRPCAEGVEMLAAVPDGVADLSNAFDNPPTLFAPSLDEMSQEESVLQAATLPAQSGRTPPPMSTVSFQDYVRQRLRERGRQSAAPAPVPSPEPTRAKAQIVSPRAKVTHPAAAPVNRTPPPAAVMSSPSSDALMAELQSLKSLISNQFDSMRWFDEVARSPVQAQLLRTMVEAGFSLKLARSVVSRLPADYSGAQATVWLSKVLARNLRCVPQLETFESGGVFALIGPTGVGKTTTTAKIAAQQVLRYGPKAVSLITVDTYRLGAHDQLRAFGRILNVPVHIAHDAAALHDLLRLRDSRQLVLIDTVGMGHRDERIGNLLSMLPRSEVRHVVVASCAAQAESIDESLRAYQASEADGVILTKLDEAARLGGAIDCLLRHRLPLLGMCDGQRVPEDWQQADADKLLRRALHGARAGAFGLESESLPTVFGVASSNSTETAHA
jgi:flagellar biosynthesis protein FlhF